MTTDDRRLCKRRYRRGRCLQGDVAYDNDGDSADEDSDASPTADLGDDDYIDDEDEGGVITADDFDDDFDM